MNASIAKLIQEVEKIQLALLGEPEHLQLSRFKEMLAALPEGLRRAALPIVQITQQVLRSGEAIMAKIKVLFLAADPTDKSKLRLGEESRSIAERVRASDGRDSIEFVQHWAVRPTDLLQVLNESRPHIVHFAGHGNTGGLAFVGAAPNSMEVIDTALIRDLFAKMRDNIRVVLLNSCYSEAQALAIVENIDHAIGMSTKIGDTAAIEFAAAFYGAIGFQRSVQEAYDQAILALRLHKIPEEHTPVLHSRAGADPAATNLLHSESTRQG